MKGYLFKRYDEIFKKYENSFFGDKLKNRGYVFQYDDNEIESDLLFVGINPSYTEKYEKNNLYRDTYSRDVDRSYFKSFKSINEELKNSKVGYNGVYTHIDLLVFRETNQKFIDSLMSTQEGCGFLIERMSSEEIKEELKNLDNKKPKAISKQDYIYVIKQEN